ncbi:MAG: hypothetical protein WCQ41_01210 [Bacillota bacterium]
MGFGPNPKKRQKIEEKEAKSIQIRFFFLIFGPFPKLFLFHLAWYIMVKKVGGGFE